MWKRTGLVAALVAMFVMAVASVAVAQSIDWVSVSSTGSGGREAIAVSDNGRFVAFGSDSVNLVPSDTNNVQDVFVKDTQTGAVERVSVSSGGVQSDADSGSDTVDISADGRWVLFESNATNLVAGMSGNTDRLYVHDRQTGVTDVIRFDGGSLPLGPNSPAGWGSISADGRYVSFSGSSGYVAGGASGVYVADLQDDSVERLIAGTDFATGHTVETTAISDDGRYVAFETRFFNSNEDVIWFDRDNPGDWKVANPRIGAAAPQGRNAGWLSISGDGRYVAHASPSDNLVAGDTPDTLDVFVFDSQTDVLERIAADGFDNAHQFWPNPVLSADGRYVAFSAGNPAWVTGQYDIVFYDRNTATAQSLTPFDTIGHESGWAFNPAMTRDARFVAFNTQSRFASGDTGSAFDVYLVDRQGSGPADSEPVGLVDPAQGFWTLYNLDGSVYRSFFFGNPGDYPIMGDWNCDGVSTPGMYRQSDGFVYLRNSNDQGIGDIRFFFGNPGDIPIVGDFNSNGCDTVSIYRPSEGRVFIINELGANEGGLGAAEFDYFFGNPGDKPFVGDFNGNGIDTIGLHRESTGFVYFRQTHTQGIADSEFFFGDPGDRLVAGDWGNVDGVDTPAIFRPSDATFYFRHTNTQGNADATLTVGQAPWIPVSGMFFEN